MIGVQRPLYQLKVNDELIWVTVWRDLMDRGLFDAMLMSPFILKPVASTKSLVELST